MDYFVSIEDTNYFGWQTEILIQSFKRLNLQDSLVVGVAMNPSSKLPKYFRNLNEHKRKFEHQNVGRDKNYLPLNRLLAIIHALNQGHLKQPFALIHADMVLTAPLAEPTIENSVTFNTEYVDSVILKKIEPLVRPIMDIKGLSEPPPLPLGASVIFNRIPTYFFSRVYQRTVQLIGDGSDMDWDIEKAAWILSCYENLGSFAFSGSNYVSPMVHNKLDVPIVHYKHGTTPYFNKLHFMYDVAMLSIGSQDPYAVILEQSPVACTKIIQDLILEINKENKTS